MRQLSHFFPARRRSSDGALSRLHHRRTLVRLCAILSPRWPRRPFIRTKATRPRTGQRAASIARASSASAVISSCYERERSAMQTVTMWPQTCEAHAVAFSLARPDLSRERKVLLNEERALRGRANVRTSHSYKRRQAGARRLRKMCGVPHGASGQLQTLSWPAALPSVAAWIHLFTSSATSEL